MSVAAPIGGEMHAAADPLYRYVTDSGRSSLRLALDRLRDRRFALPDFLCSVIIDVFRSAGVAFSTYRVRPDLSIDYEALGDFDALYTIDYFGKDAAPDRGRLPPGCVILRDSVFQPGNVVPPLAGDWIWFNSFRKISPLADGSLVVSTLELDAARMRSGVAPFVEAKRRAKAAKAAFLRDNTGSEEAYLALFREGEALIDAQADSYQISPASLAALLDFNAGLAREEAVRQANYEFLEERLGALAIPLGAGFKTLFAMSVDHRDALRRHLAERRIFLPVHWPDPYRLGNPLSERILSIPVDSRYGPAELGRVVAAIEDFRRQS
jgi:hypothetical protein